MTRISAVEQFLDSFPSDRRAELKRQILASRTSRSAYTELQQLGFTGSYDAVTNWRRANFGNLPNDNLQERANRIVQICSSENLRTDPVQRVLDLARELDSLCHRVHGMLESHKWTGEDGKLSQPDAFRLLTVLPSLARAASSGILEAHKVKVQMSEKAIALGTLFEVGEDWRKTMEHENPELVGLLEGVLAVTRSRLELDQKSLLEQAMQQQGN